MWKSLYKGGHPNAEGIALSFYNIDLGCIQLRRIKMAVISFRRRNGGNSQASSPVNGP